MTVYQLAGPERYSLRRFGDLIISRTVDEKTWRIGQGFARLALAPDVSGEVALLRAVQEGVFRNGFPDLTIND